MIAAVTMVRNEEDIIDASIRHMLAQVEFVVVVDNDSTDTTTEILRELERETGRVTYYHNPDPLFRQVEWLHQLGGFAHDQGAEWIVPFDADEFWYALSGRSIAAEIAELPPHVHMLSAVLWTHLDWNHRFIEPAELPKVAYRWVITARPWPGSHGVDGVPGEILEGVLAIRHYQYRSFEHFCRSIRDRAQRMTPEGVARGDGMHWRFLENASDMRMRVAWDEMTSAETLYDPIPRS